MFGVIVCQMTSRNQLKHSFYTLVCMTGWIALFKHVIFVKMSANLGGSGFGTTSTHLNRIFKIKASIVLKCHKHCQIWGIFGHLTNLETPNSLSKFVLTLIVFCIFRK